MNKGKRNRKHGKLTVSRRRPGFGVKSLSGRELIKSGPNQGKQRRGRSSSYLVNRRFRHLPAAPGD